MATTKTAKTKAFGYFRISGKGQISGHGIPRQRDAVARFADAHGFDVVARFEDVFTGAKDGFDRPGLTDLFVRIKANGVRVVLVERADRLARDLMVGELILAEFRKHGVKVIACDSGTDLTVDDDDPTRVLIRQVLGAVSQWDKSVIVQKLRAARERRRRDTGRCEGVKPFGTFKGEGRAVARIVELHKKSRGKPRLSLAQIAAALNDEGVPTRSGRPWARTTVHKIICRHRAA